LGVSFFLRKSLADPLILNRREVSKGQGGVYGKELADGGHGEGKAGGAGRYEGMLGFARGFFGRWTRVDWRDQGGGAGGYTRYVGPWMIAEKLVCLLNLGDVAIWPFHWLLGLKGALPEDLFSKKLYPRTYAWIERFSAAIAKAKASLPKASPVKGDEAVHLIAQAGFAEVEGDVEEKDPLRLKKGQEVEVWPTDTGFKHRDCGRLLCLTKNEAVVAAKTKVSGKEVRIHAPRAGFRIEAVRENDAKL